MSITSQIFRMLSLGVLVLAASSVQSGEAFADDSEPIAFIGHGGFFAADGRQIEVTQEFIESAQAYYRQRLLDTVNKDNSTALVELEKKTLQIPTSSRQNRLLLQNRFLASIAAGSNDPDIGQIKAKLNALNNALQMQVSERSSGSSLLSRVPARKFVPDPLVRDILQKQSLLSDQVDNFSATTSAGQKYLDECRSNGVPIPPPMGRLDPSGKAGWKSLGFIPKDAQFIVGTPAEVRVFSSDSPVGMCFALPRYVDDSLQAIELDGAICLGQLSSKVCIWDNQMPTTNPDGRATCKDSPLPQGTKFQSAFQISRSIQEAGIRPAALKSRMGTGGICTNCHAGENPYIVHPRVDLGGGLLMGKLNRPPLNLPTFSRNRYDPLVGASWPQNNYSMSGKLVPDACSGCHEKDGAGGRFPLLSTDLKKGYCAILARAIEKTMPPSKPGSLQNDAEIKAFLTHCDDAPNSANADLDP